VHVPAAEEAVGVSRPTARNGMRELAATGIARLIKSDGNAPERVVLADGWDWLLPNEAVVRVPKVSGPEFAAEGTLDTVM